TGAINLQDFYQAGII
ncbi:hypothetical protein SEEM41H_07417, partial [Salmonella enterica subsp. enterica serovar Montevideo str. 4441 H]